MALAARHWLSMISLPDQLLERGGQKGHIICHGCHGCHPIEATFFETSEQPQKSGADHRQWNIRKARKSARSVLGIRADGINDLHRMASRNYLALEEA